MHTNTLYWHARPFGCSVLVSSYDEEAGPQLHAIEPSGVCYVRVTHVAHINAIWQQRV